MNKYIQRALLGTSAAALAFSTGCGEDEAPDLLVGEWTIEYDSEEYTPPAIANLFKGSNLRSETLYESYYTINFKSDGTMGNCGHYLIDGEEVEGGCNQDTDVEWSWVKKNKTLELTFSDPEAPESVMFTFAELDGDSFAAIIDVDYDGDGEIDYSSAIRAERYGNEADWDTNVEMR